MLAFLFPGHEYLSIDVVSTFLPAVNSPNGIGSGIIAHSTEHVHEHAAIRMPPLLSPVATAPYCELGSHCGTGQHIPPLPSQWQASSYSFNGNRFLAGMCQLASVAEDTAAPTIPCMALFPDPMPSVSSRAESIIGDYSWGRPALPDCSLEEVAQINLRIHLANHALLSEMEQRQMRVRNQVKAVERLLG